MMARERRMMKVAAAIAGLMLLHLVTEVPLMGPSSKFFNRRLKEEKPELGHYKDVWEPREEKGWLAFMKWSQVPVFWHIPFSESPDGFSAVKEALGLCHGLTFASEAGVADGHDTDTVLQKVKIGNDPKQFVNVDTSNLKGLLRAKTLGLAESRMADVISVHSIFDGEQVFMFPGHRGRVFTVVSDPIDRAVRTYTHLQKNPPRSAEMAASLTSIEAYARSPYVENNWMTRYLSNQVEGELTEEHVQVAMDVVRRKILVGLADDMEASMERFERYFGWEFDSVDTADCRSKLVTRNLEHVSVTDSSVTSLAPEGSVARDLLRIQNSFDLQLYGYIKVLFQQQERLVSDVPTQALGKNPEAEPEITPSDSTITIQVETATDGGKPAVEGGIVGTTYIPKPGDVPEYFCEDRYPGGFTNEPLPNPFPLLSGTVRPCYDAFRNFPSPPNQGDIPAFWHVPKAGGSTIKDIVGHCMGLTQVDEVGVRNGHEDDKVLEVVEEEGNYYLNVDPTQTSGIQKARTLGMASSGLADVVTLINIQDADYMFTQQHKGRLFTLLRDPVERAVSMFFYLSKADWEPTYNPAYADMTLLEYSSRGGPIENNFMVRFLANQRRGVVGEEQLAYAKIVLKKKFLVGLLHKTEESFDRFQKYFGFKAAPWKDKTFVNECVQGLLRGGSNQNTMVKKPKVEKGSPEYQRILSQNNLDMKLYEYALELFEEQAQHFR